MANSNTYRIKTISEFHRLRSLPSPDHPLISVVDYSKVHMPPEDYEVNWTCDFYNISIKRGCSKMKYGQQVYDFDEGVMSFIAPNQVFKIIELNPAAKRSGYMLLLHPDFLWNTSLAKIIKQYEYFDYSVNEALFLSEKEEATINGIVGNIQQEYHSNIDNFSQQIIISQIETLLNYSERFYHRQFITRKISNHKILSRLENTLTDYFNSRNLINKGLPTVQSVAGELNVSTNI